MSADAIKFLDEAARVLPEEPDPRLEADLVSRLAANAAAANGGRRRRQTAFRLPTLRMPARVAIAAGALLVSTAGLAVAGVKLPGPLDDGFSRVGIDLPNQSRGQKAAEPGTEDGAGDDGAAPVTVPGVGTERKGERREPHGRAKGHEKPRGEGHHGHGRPESPGHSAEAPGQTKPSPGRESAPGQTKPKTHEPKPKPDKAQALPKPAKPPQAHSPDPGKAKGHDK